MKNAINWFEIPVTDLPRAKKFYEEIFNFEMQELDIGDGLEIALFPVAEGAVGGAIIKNEEWYHPSESKGPILYLNANPNLQKVLDKIEKAGGEVLIPKRIITEEHGYMAVFKDSEGNRIALHSDQ